MLALTSMAITTDPGGGGSIRGAPSALAGPAGSPSTSTSGTKPSASVPALERMVNVSMPEES